ncbi:hypothetical protein DEJ15_01295 [Curtobacterium sp. MCJR17_043]|nr:hypothetical protein [Curtobacterium sp. MCJR17_043]WIB35963.1 hypothetical protein DEJ15_01295 [Curtobacterium sp. MCJR17_043]
MAERERDVGARRAERRGHPLAHGHVLPAEVHRQHRAAGGLVDHSGDDQADGAEARAVLSGDRAGAHGELGHDDGEGIGSGVVAGESGHAARRAPVRRPRSVGP